MRSALLYSTLGWFDDPIPRGFLSFEPALVFATILHELVHETIYVRGDTEYNEGLATFIAHEGAIRHFAAEPEPLEVLRRHAADETRFARLIRDLSEELEANYRSAASVTQIWETRKAIFSRFQKQIYPTVPWETSRFDDFGEQPLSNAYVIAHRMYFSDLPCFRMELQDLGGDLEAFIAAHRHEPGRRSPRGSCERAARDGP